LELNRTSANLSDDSGANANSATADRAHSAHRVRQKLPLSLARRAGRRRCAAGRTIPPAAKRFQGVRRLFPPIRNCQARDRLGKQSRRRAPPPPPFGRSPSPASRGRMRRPSSPMERKRNGEGDRPKGGGGGNLRRSRSRVTGFRAVFTSRFLFANRHGEARIGLVATSESRNQPRCRKNLCESSTRACLCYKSRASTQNSAPKRFARASLAPGVTAGVKSK
jgi:hypothetical protein